MTKNENLNSSEDKIYDLEERTLEFSKRIVRLAKALPKNVVNNPIINQLIKSGTSGGANYIEANEALSKKDFFHRMKIARKETKEAIYWLKITIEANPDLEARIKPLLAEAIEIKKIFSSIIEKSK